MDFDPTHARIRYSMNDVCPDPIGRMLSMRVREVDGVRVGGGTRVSP